MKRGQGISINLIIVAVIALVALVVIVAIFSGQFAKFGRGLSEQEQNELTTMRIQYGASCQPVVSEENKFISDLRGLETEDDKQVRRQGFKSLIARCNAANTQDACNAENSCLWTGQ